MFHSLARAWRGDIRVRLYAAVCLAVMVSTGMYTAYDVHVLSREAEKSLDDRMGRLVKVVSESLARPLFDFNSAAVASTVSAVGANQDVAYVRVVDAEGNLVAQARSRDVPADRALVSRHVVQYHDGGQDIRVGQLELALSREALDEDLREEIFRTLLANVLMTLAIIASIYAIARKASRPFSDIQDSLERLAHGGTDISLSGVGREDQIGRLSEAVLSFRDTIALLRQAKVEREKLLREKEAMLDNALVGILTVKNRVVLSCNRRLEEMFGFDSGELIGHDTRKLYAEEEDYERIGRGYEALARGRNFSTEVALKRKDGQLLWGAIAGHAHDRDNPMGMESTWIYFDITERRAAEEALSRHRAHLEEAVAARTRELADATLQAEQASRSKSEFLANMSHEIRTPMNAVLGLADLCLKTELAPRQRDWLQKIQGAGNALLGIINDILDLSKIEAGKLEVERTPFDLWGVLEKVGIAAGQRAVDKNLEFILAADPAVPTALLGDPVRLGQVLINLAGNAVKFTDKGEVRIEVALEGPPEEGRARLRFAVSDTGMGIGPEKLAALFQPFSQGDSSTTRRFGGTGLGLTISRRLVGLMGGDITVQSLAGAGSVFSFIVPLGMGVAEAEPQALPAELMDKVALLAVGNEAKARSVQTQLGRLGIRSVFYPEEGAGADFFVTDGRGSPPAPDMPVLRLARQAGRSGAGEVAVPEPVAPSGLRAGLMELLVPGGGRRPAGDDVLAVPSLAGCRILLAEDVDLNREILAELLKATGAVVDEVENGVEAVARVLGHEPGYYAMVLMDIQMPELDGLSATTRILREPRHAGLPIIALTAHAFREDKERSLAAGMKDHITKPVVPGQIYAVLSRWCPGRGASVPPARPPQEPEDRLPELPGVDTGLLLARMRGKAASCRRILWSFRERYADIDRRIGEALEQADYAAATDLVHNLKGVAGNINATDLHRLAAELEQGCRAADAVRAASSLAAVSAELARVQASLAGLFP